jgi:glycerol-3-phosphate dehydrogenase
VTSRLNGRRRAGDLDRVAGGEFVDLLVVGGGLRGAAVALDAAARGLSVCQLVEGDLTAPWASIPAAATWTGTVERGLLMTTVAPHLVRPTAALIPFGGNTSAREIATVTARAHAADALRRAARTPAVLVPPPRRVSAVEALALVSGLSPAGLRGGLLFFDGLVSHGARLTVAVARTAAARGAKVIGRVRVVDAGSGGAEAIDDLTGARFFVRARAVARAGDVATAQQVVDENRYGTRETAVLLGGTWVVPDRAGRAIASTASEGPADVLTYRRDAERIVDATAITSTPSPTAEIPLVGATPWTRLSTVDAEARLVRRYGADAAPITALGELDAHLREPLSPNGKTIAAEVVWAVRNEGALDLDDVATRVGPLDTAAGQAARELITRALNGLT